ncbi:MAG: ribonuclease J [Alcanivorax sp.]
MKDVFSEEEFYFVPLGGSEEFGANLNLYVCNGEYLAIDCGIGFADERYPGIDLLLPDPWLLEENKDKLNGIVITHAHEDHIGALAYLWDRFQCPIYTTKFTASVLRKKFEQEGVDDAKIIEIALNASIDVGVFNLTFVPVSHSVPDSVSVFIDTPHGNILHSGDWNLDPSPVVGVKTQEQTFRALGDKNVLAYVGDSTNSQVDGYSGSEADVELGLAEEFKKCPKKIAVTTFSSNIGRVISIARAARDVGRSVVLIGRSLHRMVGCAYECGLMKDVPDFLTEDDIQHIPDENLVLIVTGSQGEHRAALAKIARGEYRSVSLNKGDTVIFSARAIPGNDRNINTVKNNLSAAGVRIVTPKSTDNIIHISGHPCRDEIAEMLGWVRPDTVIPVHGERMQLDAHSKLATECQIGHTLVPNNGSVIKLAPGKPEIIDHVETGLLAVDLARIIPITHQSITARRKLQYSGTVHASVILDSNFNILGEIKIDTVGLSCKRNDDCMIEDLRHHISDVLDNSEEESEEQIAEEVRISLRRYVSNILGLKPKTTVHVTCLDV